MGEAKRVTHEVRDAREAARQAGAVAARQDLMRRAVDGMANTIRWRMQTLTPDEMTTVLGTMVGIFAGSAGGPAGAEAIVSRVDQVARAVLEQAGETA